MRVFLDTSSLFKRYVEESGSDALARLIAEASELAVSPTTWIEVNSVLERHLRGGRLAPDKADWLRTEIKKDFAYFAVVSWNEVLENKALEVVRDHPLKTMDAIQLAAGILSDPEVFVTSDYQLNAAAKKNIKHVRLI